MPGTILVTGVGGSNKDAMAPNFMPLYASEWGVYTNC